MLVMDTRRLAPLRPVAESMLRRSPRVGIKETFVLRSKPLSHTHVASATAYTVLADPREGPSRVASPCMTMDKSGSDTHSDISRSSTPVTEASSFCPSTGSSFATSVPQEVECDQNYCDGRWGDDYLDEEDLAAAKGALNSKMLRQSQLRYSMSVRPAYPDYAGSDAGDNEGTHEEVAEFDEDDAWSGNDSFDAAVIAAVDGDLSLAAFLIPLLHRDLQNAVRDKVESWQVTSTPARGPSSVAGRTVKGEGRTSGRGSSSSTGTSSRGKVQRRSSDHNRKRRRRPSDSEEDREDGDDDNGGNGGSGIPGSLILGDIQMPLLACPFHKLNPAKYGIQHNVTSSPRVEGYRACAGPGFKSVQRLKEHLKRKHTPVQCERCYHIFSGSDKASSINELTEHLRLEVPCQRGDPILKEGISEAQWAALDKQNRKKNQEMHKVEKWFEIWRIVFPDTPEPETPWYNEATQTRSPMASTGNEAFADLFLHILNHKVQQGDISFPGCTTEDVQMRLRGLVLQTFRTYVSLHGPMSNSTETSSSQTGTNNHQSSLIGGSSTHLSHNNNLSLPGTMASHTTGTVMSQMYPQALALNMQTVSAGNAPGAAYAVPMGRRTANYAQYHGAVTMAPMPTQVATSGGSAMAAMAGGFTGHGQEEMAIYYTAPMMHWSSANTQYGSSQLNVAGVPQFSQTEFFNLTGNFPDGGDYGNN